MPDAQAAHEFTLTALLTALAGANLIYGAGMLELGITFDYAQMLMDNEMARMVKQAVRGIRVSDETLAVDVVKEVGTAGNFISQDHTFTHMRTQSQSKLIDRRMRENWLAEGGKDFTERAYAEAISILENHRPEPLPDKVVAQLRAIVEETEVEYGIKK
ncbi:trimethylamine-corrinoid protein Co-methyltransferase [Acididesulfobacillus acetoxydans]|uniref:Trimethylamine methyltransferase MttB n=1 Tax=Acididesulfobacillus acetoxydans TaxID=1561005 RepID=A0A8S0Y0S1_9FIRM|nr:trimethylamine-corrinoid protein Co-methyltransferase [Acididesulfobacillus acetoxydans]CEJ07168.1 Trimethylamine methyltransferase MttB [Acididesulfobacillus acetoxydans]